MPDFYADVVIIGGGVTGTAIARELSRFELQVILVEKEADLACGSSGANSGIIHAGYDAEPGTLKAELNVRSSTLFARLANELDVPFLQTGSMVVAADEAELPVLEGLRERGRRNGVSGLKILLRDEILKKESKITPRALAALWAPTAGITCPYHLVFALAENASANGVIILRETRVTGIATTDKKVSAILTDRGTIRAGFIINAAGIYADAVASMVGEDIGAITPRRGEYLVLDRDAGLQVRNILFPAPSALGKGILVTPTVDGNILVGPNAENIADREDRATTRQGLDMVAAGARRLVPDIPLSKSIARYAGLRATIAGGDFVIAPSRRAKGLVNVAGIDSPGLSAAPAIAEMVTAILMEEGLVLKWNKSFDPTRKRIERFADADYDRIGRLVRGNPDYGEIVCRCEKVSRAEILEAVGRQSGATTMDGIKRRTRAGMGRCQGGFCGSLVMEILADQLGTSPDRITRRGGKSQIAIGNVKDLLLEERQMKDGKLHE